MAFKCAGIQNLQIFRIKRIVLSTNFSYLKNLQIRRNFLLQFFIFRRNSVFLMSKELLKLLQKFIAFNFSFLEQFYKTFIGKFGIRRIAIFSSQEEFLKLFAGNQNLQIFHIKIIVLSRNFSYLNRFLDQIKISSNFHL